VRCSGLALQYVDGPLQDDLEVVTAAVQQDGTALQFASQRLRKDQRVLQLAVKQNGNSLRFGEPPADHAVPVLRAATEHVESRCRQPVSFHLDLKSRPGHQQEELQQAAAAAGKGARKGDAPGRNGVSQQQKQQNPQRQTVRQQRIRLH
jgi:hypothetical protein